MSEASQRLLESRKQREEARQWKEQNRGNKRG
jgi:hypothetical protein